LRSTNPAWPRKQTEKRHIRALRGCREKACANFSARFISSGVESFRHPIQRVVDAVRRKLRHEGSLSTLPTDALDTDVLLAGLLRYRPGRFVVPGVVLAGAGSAAEDFVWKSVVGTLGSVCVELAKEGVSLAL